MAFHDSVDMSYSQYFYALKNIQLVVVHVVGCYLNALLDFFCIFLRVLVDEMFHEDPLSGIGKDDKSFLDIYDKNYLFFL
jgi:hypothetical protein